MTITIDGSVGANKGVVLDSNGKLPAIDGSQVTALNATQITTGTVAAARLDTGTTAGKVLVLDGSGNMPAVDASLMTGVASATKSASNPTGSTNPATGLGTKWINTTTGDVYILTDATAGANVWTNSGAGTGDIIPYNVQGEIAGYTSGGLQTGVPNDLVDTIDRVSFTSDGNSTDVANLFEVYAYGAGVSSTTYGYTCGGRTYPAPTEHNRISKFQFGTTNNSTDVADLQSTKQQTSGTMNQTHGFIHGGYDSNVGMINVIDKLTFSTEANATDHGDLSFSRSGLTSNSSSTHGYACGGGYAGPPRTDVIDKYAFTSNTTATDVGNLTAARAIWSAGTMSDTYGYTHGGDTPYQNTIDRFSFSSDGNAADWADLSYTWAYMSGTSSTTYGYCAGGYTSGGTPGPNSGYTNYIEKYPYATQTNASDVGDLTTMRYACSGTHY